MTNWSGTPIAALRDVGKFAVLIVFIFSFLGPFTVFSLAGVPCRTSLESINSQTISIEDLVPRIEDFLKMTKAIRPETTDLFLNNRIVVRGFPAGPGSQVRRLTGREISNTIFRHYTTKANIGFIMKSRVLRAGKTPYVASPLVFTDVKGIFLTTRTADPLKVGLDKTFSECVDLTLDPRIPVIFLEDGIYLVPGVNDPQPWMVKQYSAVDPAQLPESVRGWAIFGWQATDVPFNLVAQGRSR